MSTWKTIGLERGKPMPKLIIANCLTLLGPNLERPGCGFMWNCLSATVTDTKLLNWSGLISWKCMCLTNAIPRTISAFVRLPIIARRKRTIGKPMSYAIRNAMMYRLILLSKNSIISLTARNWLSYPTVLSAICLIPWSLLSQEELRVPIFKQLGWCSLNTFVC